MRVWINDYYFPEDGFNWSWAVKRACEANLGDNIEFAFKKGKYDFYEAGTNSAQCWESNNDSGEKNVLFLFKNSKHISIRGGGSEWVLHGYISPVVADGCFDVTVSDFSVDCQRPFYTEGVIVRSGPEEIELDINRKNFPYKVCGTNFVPMGDVWENNLSDLTPLCQEFVTNTGVPAQGGHTAFAKIGNGTQCTDNLPAFLWKLNAYETERGTLLLRGNFTYTMTPGNTLVMTHEKRTNSFFFCCNSSEIKLKNVVLHHIGSMGFIAQNCKNILVEHFYVLPKEDSGRIISINADATHFVNCSGTVTLRDCIFESMMDDGVNIHGIYTEIEQVDVNSMLVALKHFQQEGVMIYRAGDRVAVLDKESMLPLCETTVVTAEQVDKTHIRIYTKEPIAAAIGNIVENFTNMPQVLIEGCRIGKNRPRGVLVGTGKKAVIRNNVFYSCSCGVKIPGEIAYWYESGPAYDITICDNHFERCGYLDNDYAIVLGCDGMLAHADYYHHNITIKNNRFDLYSNRLLKAYKVDGIHLCNNTIYPSEYKTELNDCINFINE